MGRRKLQGLEVSCSSKEKDELKMSVSLDVSACLGWRNYRVWEVSCNSKEKDGETTGFGRLAVTPRRRTG